jgi:hypothetical protein
VNKQFKNADLTTYVHYDPIIPKPSHKN